METENRSLPEIESFSFDHWQGEIAIQHRPRQLEAEISRLIDPSAAEKTIYWGRNYLYRSRLETPDGSIPVVVKQFRNNDWRSRWRRQRGDGKAERSWRNALRFQAAGVHTAEPIAVIGCKRPEGPSFFISRHLEPVIEARYLLRAANQGEEKDAFPTIDFEGFLKSLGKTLRRLHEAGLFHRDLSIGNVLLVTDGAERGQIYLVDLNRARQRQRLSLSQRTRDLCRLAIFRRQHQQLFLDAYWGEEEGGAGGFATAIYQLYHHAFLYKIAAKKRFRRVRTVARQWILPRRAHAHIPAAPEGSSTRDKIVWDHLSDQPHQHAGRFEKTLVRLADGPSHVRQSAAVVAAMPRIWRRYRKLQEQLYRQPLAWDGVGLAVRPWPQAPDDLLRAIIDAGARKILVRLHPWEGSYDAEVELARELAQRGYELAFAIPQNRDLVRDPQRWRAQIEEIAERFVPFGHHFQIGQAINRSKWGVWTYHEYLQLATIASEVLRRSPTVEILGPAVIDFEAQATASVLNLRSAGVYFDIVASLLYVDRRGAPENRQIGFDTVDKVVLLKAIAETGRNCGPRSWITEVNWPLWEGPHSPAGRSVSVDEKSQADFLVRYFVLALTTGMVERVYWWQLIAQGYGLIDPNDTGEAAGKLRRRPSFLAFATLNQMLSGSRFLRRLEAPPGAFLWLFERQDGSELVVGWNVEGQRDVALPRAAIRHVDSRGEEAPGQGVDVELRPEVGYFALV